MVSKRYRFEGQKLTIDGRPILIPEYRFEEELGSGANGVVIKSTDIHLEREVAVKVWLPRNGKKLPDKERFLSEARKIAKLNHENIARIYHTNYLDTGHFYAVFEYIHGETLANWLREGRDLYERTTILDQICRAMKYAYSCNVLHGDLHPKNIMITKNGEVKVLDFGTSIFCKNIGQDPQVKERKVFLETGLKLLSEEKKYTFLDYDKVKNIPIILIPDLLLATSSLLSTTSMLSSIVKDYSGELYDDDTDYDIRREIMKIAYITISDVPFFDLSSIIDFFNKIGLSEYYLDVFISVATPHCHAEIADLKRYVTNPLKYDDNSMATLQIDYERLQCKILGAPRVNPALN